LRRSLRREVRQVEDAESLEVPDGAAVTTSMIVLGKAAAFLAVAITLGVPATRWLFTLAAHLRHPGIVVTPAALTWRFRATQPACRHITSDHDDDRLASMLGKLESQQATRSPLNRIIFSVMSPEISTGEECSRRESSTSASLPLCRNR